MRARGAAQDRSHLRVVDDEAAGPGDQIVAAAPWANPHIDELREAGSSLDSLVAQLEAAPAWETDTLAEPEPASVAAPPARPAASPTAPPSARRRPLAYRPDPEPVAEPKALDPEPAFEPAPVRPLRPARPAHSPRQPDPAINAYLEAERHLDPQADLGRHRYAGPPEPQLDAPVDELGYEDEVDSEIALDDYEETAPAPKSPWQTEPIPFSAPTRPAVTSRQPRPVPNWIAPSTRNWLRAAIVLLALAPLTMLLSTRLAHLAIDPILGLYAVATICTTGLVMFLAFARYRDPSMAPAVDTHQPLISCLVAVKNEEDVIPRCLMSLLDSTYPNLEVIVVDDGSTDGTRDILNRMGDAYPALHVLELPYSVGKKRALTVAAMHAHGEVFVFTDSDCVLAQDAIDRVVMAFQSNPKIGAVSGHARALNGDANFLTKVQDTWYEGQFSVWKAAESSFGAVSCVSGPLAAFRREAIYNYLPAWANDSFMGKEFRFATDRQLTGYVLGARSVGKKLKQEYANSPFVRGEDHPIRDWRIEYVKSARVWTMVPSSMKKLMTQQVRWKKSFIRNLFFTGSFYFRRGIVPSLMFYTHVMFVLAMPFMAIRHLIWFPAHGAWVLSGLYLAGVFFKGTVWAVAYKWENPKSHRWVYRPFMSVLTAIFFSGLLLYSLVTLRRNVWVRG